MLIGQPKTEEKLMIMTTRKRAPMLLLLAVYAYVLVKIILFKYGPVDLRLLGEQLMHIPERAESIRSRFMLTANLKPFESIRQNLQHLQSSHQFVNFAGNIAIFMPLGGFVRQGTRLNALGAAVAAAVASLMLESSQALFMMGTFDVDDIILNGFGGLLGYAVWAAVASLGRKGPAGKSALADPEGSAG